MTISNEAVEALMDKAHDSGFVLKRSLAHDWLEAAAPIIRARALEDAAEAIDWIRPEMGPGINITQYREGRNDALTSAAEWLRARAAAERGRE